MAGEQEVKDHPIWTAIEQFSGLKGDPVLIDTALDPQAFGLAQQVFEFVLVVEQRLQSCPATLISKAALSQLNKALAGAANEIRNFISNKNIAHLTNAVNSVEQTGFPALSQIPILAGEDIGKLANDFASQVQGILKSALEERDRLRKEREDLTARVGELVSQVQKLSETVAKQNADALNVVQAVQTQYAAKEQEFVQSSKSASDARLEEHDQLMKQLKDAAKADRDSLAARALEIVGAMEKDRDHAKDVLKIIGNIGVTGNYQKTADAETSMANVWRGITVAFFAVSIGVGVWALASTHEVDLKLTIARMLFAFLILGATVYTGRESARHRTTADRAKRVELELASLGPFLESLPAEKQSELRAKLTELYFGKEGEAHQVKADVSAKELISLLKLAIERAAK